MKKRPLVFKIQAIIFVLLAFSFPIQAYWKADLEVEQMSLAFALLSPMNYFTIANFFLLAFTSLKASPALKVLLPLSFTTVAVNNFWAAGLFDENFLESFVWAVGPATAFYSAILYFLMFKTHQTKILENTDLHWWKIPPRFHLELPLWFAKNGKALGRAKTLDIAEGGVFIPISNEDNDLSKFIVGEALQLHLDLNGNILQCHGVLARIETQPKGTYPSGIGVKFESLDFHNLKTIRNFLTEMKSKNCAAH